MGAIRAGLPLKIITTPSSLLVLSVFLLLLLALYWPALFDGRTLLHGDNIGHGLALLHTLHEFFHGDGALLWSDGIYGGFPLFSEGQGAFLNPLNIVAALLFTPITALNAYHLLAMFTCGAGMFLLSRTLGASPWASGIAVIGSVFSVLWMNCQENVTVSGALAWLPWMIWSMEKWVRQPDYRWAAAFGACTSLLVFAGYPQMLHGGVLYMAVSLCVVPFQPTARAVWRDSLGRRVATGAFAVLVCVGLSAVQWIPLLQLVSESARESGTQLLSMHPIQDYFHNFFFVVSDAESHLPYLLMVGSFLVLLLAALIVLVPSPDRVKGHILATALLLLLGMGEQSAVFRFVYDYHLIPGMHSFRIMFIYLYLFVLGAALLAAFSVDGLVALARQRRWRDVRVARLVGACVLYALVLWSFFDRVALTELFVVQNVWVAVALLMVLLLLLLGRHAWLPPVLFGVLLLEIVLFRMGGLGFHDRDYLAEPDTVRWIDQSGLRRTYKVRNLTFANMFTFLPSTTEGLGERAQAALSAVVASSNVLWGIDSPNGTFGLPLRRHALAAGQFQREYAGEGAGPGGRLIDLLSQRLVTTTRPLDLPGFSVAYRSQASGVVINENRFALPVVRAVSGHEVVPGPEEALARLTQGDVRGLVIEAGVDGPPPVPTPGGDGIASQGMRIEVLAAESGRYLVEVDADTNGWLFIADAPYPGWRATVDGEEAPVYAANLMGKAIPFAAGRHTVAVRYRPTAFYTGALISLLSLAALAWCMLRYGLKGSTDAA